MSARKLIKKLDLEEVLDELGLLIERRTGADAYALCPHPDHFENRASFHVCVEDVVDSKGRNRIGWANCWSHPDDEMQISDFTVLVAKIRSEAWNRDPTKDEIHEARRWLLDNAAPDPEAAARRRAMAHRRANDREGSELLWPPTVALSDAPTEIAEYLALRGIGPTRAAELGARAVLQTGDRLTKVLGDTIPGVLFPIRHLGEEISWYVRSIDRDCPGKFKSRYSPRAFLQTRGVLWSPGEPVASRPIVLVEGIFDADRVSQLIIKKQLPFEARNVLSVLGGNLHESQARRIRTLCPPRVLVIGDGDKGGEKMGNSVVQYLGGIVEVQNTPIGTDPGDCREEVLIRMLGGQQAKHRATRVLVRKVRR